MSNSAFQSTLPLRGATSSWNGVNYTDDISIHAPLTGSDFLRLSTGFLLFNFNPRSPYGERLGTRPIIPSTCQFQSTLPLRGATSKFRKCDHATALFQSTLPLRGATLYILAI